MTAFNSLATPVQKWIRSQGWEELRDIQARAVQAILGTGSDIIISAATAGGKTEAAFLPLVSQLLEEDEEASGFKLVYVGPLKALINDQHKRLADLCRATEVSVTPWHGDVSAHIKAKAKKSPNGILLITPESLEAMFVRNGLEIHALFGSTSAIVIDELHTFLDTERGVQLRSLLTRLELSVGRTIRRIGLSATLGDMELTKSYLRSKSPETVTLLKAEEGGAELKMQLRGYAVGGSEVEESAVKKEIATHLFRNMRGSNNLVFAGARRRVEEYADQLRLLCEEARVPQEFYPHHASLSRDHRAFIEKRLKEATLPTTAVCTSTLELGIDIGDVACVAQIGPPFTVAGLRQRLGRSGRRHGEPAILRQYITEVAISHADNFADRLRLRLLRSIAMIELLLEGWYEPPRGRALHLSTLVHQILSVISERGGASARRLFVTLCQHGPFSSVSQATFISVLKHIGQADVGLIEQAENGLLLLGATGEKIAEHYSFFAVFKTPEEYRIVNKGKTLGTIPLDNLVAPQMTIIFSGRRWEVLSVSDREKVIEVRPSKAGVLPKFGGEPGDIHDKVIEKMYSIYTGNKVPAYLDATARTLLEEARGQFNFYNLASVSLIQIDTNSYVFATRAGTVKTRSLALAFRALGFKVFAHDGFLELFGHKESLSPTEALRDLSQMTAKDLFNEDTNLVFEKFHQYLSPALLQIDALSTKLDVEALSDF